MELIRFGNGLESHFAFDPSSLPKQIWVERPGAPEHPFDTGEYTYDDARNITAMGRIGSGTT